MAENEPIIDEKKLREQAAQMGIISPLAVDNLITMIREGEASSLSKAIEKMQGDDAGTNNDSHSSRN